MPDARAQPSRPWWAIDLPKVLVFCLFVAVVEAIAGITYYRRHVAMIPAIGQMAPAEPGCDGGDDEATCADEMTIKPPTRETPEELQ